MKLETKVKRVNAKLDKLNAELKHIQDVECQHPDATLLRKAGANTGNWCAGDDSYWYDFHCQVCGKQWNTDQTWEHGQRGTEVKDKYYT